jgi:cytochrome c oxidase subunit 4
MVWIVGFQFMELRHAPRWLRHSFDTWVTIVCATLVIICLA